MTALTARATRRPRSLQRGGAFRRPPRRRRTRKQDRDRVRRRAHHVRAAARAREPLRQRAAERLRRAARRSASCCCSLDGPAFVYTFFGAIKIGAVPIPVNTLWKPADYRHVLNDSRARRCSSSARSCCRRSTRSCPPSALALRHIVVAGSGAGAATQSRSSSLSPGCDADARSRPTTRAMRRRSGCIRRAAPARRKAACTCSTTWSCAPSCSAKACSASADDRSMLQRREAVFRLRPRQRAVLSVRRRRDERFSGRARRRRRTSTRVIETHRPTLFFSVPTGYGMLLGPRRSRGDDRDFDLSCVRLAVSAGEALPPALYERFKQRFGVDIIDGIGSTETLHMFISNRPGAIRPGSSGLIVRRLRGARCSTTTRRPVPSRRDRQPVDQRRLDVRRLLEPAREDRRARSRATGSAPATSTSQDADGFYWYAGRTDDMLKVGGLWVSPVEVENALVAHAAVLECGVVGREDHDALVKPMAFVVLRAGVHGTPELAGSCSSSCASGSPSTSGRGGSGSSPSCRRPRPARSSGSSCARRSTGPSTFRAGVPFNADMRD